MLRRTYFQRGIEFIQSDLAAFLFILGLCAALLYIVPANACDDDTYILDRELFPPEVRERCESPGQGMAPPFMIDGRASALK